MSGWCCKVSKGISPAVIARATRAALVLALAVLVSCSLLPSVSVSAPGDVTPGSASGVTTGSPLWGHRTKTSGCAASGGLPDSACTPGDIIVTATKDVICVSGYSQTVRNVPTSEKDAVYAEYGIASHTAGDYEVDHFVSLELGGSNDISNLWPELASPKPGFHEKDKVENYLHDKVCRGQITLADAQREIATDWLKVYKEMLGN
jgi:hypothetical protein